MSNRVAYLGGSAFPRLALTGLALLWLAGCSTDVTRFDANPFANPFSSHTADATPAGAAPSGHVAEAPLAPAATVASAPLPAAASTPAPHGATASAAVGGSATGWTAAGGSPIVVAQGETLDTLSRRYGVPSAALLSANGLSSPSEVKGGMRVIVPVYNARGHAVAAASAGKTAEAPSKKRGEDVASDDRKDAAKSKKPKDKAEGKAKIEEAAADKPKGKAAKDKSAREPAKTTVAAKAEPAKAEPAKTAAAKTAAAKTAAAKSDPAKTAVVAKAEPGKPGKKPAIDDTPTGNVDPKAAQEPVTAAQADASGATPEFRWPARGRIIEGFKSGGNDGINISVPPGTSVRAAENGVVVYSGDGLKGYGNLVLIKHPNGFVTAYANNGELDVKRGETVKRGQIIAKSGDTGNVNAPQLHFELRKGSTPVDPTNYLAGL